MVGELYRSNQITSGHSGDIVTGKIYRSYNVRQGRSEKYIGARLGGRSCIQYGPAFLQFRFFSSKTFI